MLVSHFLLNSSFFLGNLSFPSPAEKRISVHWEAELLSKCTLNPGFSSCVHFTVCYTGVYCLTVTRWSMYPVLQCKTLVSKVCLLICTSVFIGTELVVWEVHGASLSLIIRGHILWETHARIFCWLWRVSREPVYWLWFLLLSVYRNLVLGRKRGKLLHFRGSQFCFVCF